MDRPIKLEYRFLAYEYDAITQHNVADSPLLRLPAEIRNAIYEHVFDAATLERDSSPPSTGRYRIVQNGSRLLLVCRQIRFEARPFQNGSTYHHLDVRMEGRHVPDLIGWVGEQQCARIAEIGIFQSLACAISRQVRNATVQGQYTSLWAAGGDCFFPSLKRVVVTYSTYRDEDGYDVETSLQMLFGKIELEVNFRVAVYWG